MNEIIELKVVGSIFIIIAMFIGYYVAYTIYGKK